MDNVSYARLPRESLKAHAAFVVYRDLGRERSLRAVAKLLHRSRQLIDRWSRRHDWVARCRAWDDHRDFVLRKAQLRTIEEMGERHAALSLMIQDVIAQRLSSMTPEEVAKLSFRDLIAGLQAATQVERRARGEPEAI